MDMTDKKTIPCFGTRVLARLLILSASTVPTSLQAQSVEGTSYYLPKTALRYTIQVEKTTYTAGRLAPYARRYLKQDVEQNSATSYRIIGITTDRLALPDTSKRFQLTTDKKYSIHKVCRASNGQLLAINAEAEPAATPQPTFTPAPKPQPVNPNDFMSEDILNAGNPAKMAELTAREIYDIRESRNQLNRGEADFMPKDGAQLRIMLANLDKQEQALRSLFEGTVTKDTTWTSIDFTPTAEGRSLLFRFSQHYGLTSTDDLGGSPYYIQVEDLHTVAPPTPIAPGEKKEDKNDIGLRVCQPGRIRLTVSDSQQQMLATDEVLAPQFGTTESLSGELFGKKQSTRIVLSPLTGSVKAIESFTQN